MNWTRQSPTIPGKYRISCMEIDYEEEEVKVYHHHSGDLWVEDQGIGTRPLEMYHENLTDLQWKGPL